MIRINKETYARAEGFVDDAERQRMAPREIVVWAVASFDDDRDHEDFASWPRSTPAVEPEH